MPVNTATMNGIAMQKMRINDMYAMGITVTDAHEGIVHVHLVTGYAMSAITIMSFLK